MTIIFKIIYVICRLFKFFKINYLLKLNLFSKKYILSSFVCDLPMVKVMNHREDRFFWKRDTKKYSKCNATFTYGHFVPSPLYFQAYSYVIHKVTRRCTILSKTNK